MTVYFAIDTNAFIHFKLFSEIDWTEVLEAPDVTMLMTRTIVKELDDKKNHQDRFLSTKAKNVIKKLEGCLTDKQFTCHGKTIPVEFHKAIVLPEFYTQHDLTESSADDRFLAEVEMFRHAHPDDRVLVVSGDLGMRMKTEWLGVEFLKLDEDKYRHKNEDPVVKENESLKRQLQRIQNAQPDLKLTFIDAEPPLRLVRPRVRVHTDEDITLLVQRERERFYELDEEDKPFRAAHVSRVMGFGEPNISDYKEAWEQYIEALPEYLKGMNRYDLEMMRSLKLGLRLENNGGAPAQGAGIHIMLPEGMAFVEEDDFKDAEAPKKLERPKLTYKSRLDSFSAISAMVRQESAFARLNAAVYAPPNLLNKIHRPVWRADGRSAEIEVGELRNRYNKDLPAIYVRMDEPVALTSFQVAYNIEAGLVEGFKGRLNVIVTDEAPA